MERARIDDVLSLLADAESQEIEGSRDDEPIQTIGQPSGGVEREVGQDRVGPGPLEGEQCLQRRRPSRRSSRCWPAALSIAYSPLTW